MNGQPEQTAERGPDFRDGAVVGLRRCEEFFREIIGKYEESRPQADTVPAGVDPIIHYGLMAIGKGSYNVTGPLIFGIAIAQRLTGVLRARLEQRR